MDEIGGRVPKRDAALTFYAARRACVYTIPGPESNSFLPHKLLILLDYYFVRRNGTPRLAWNGRVFPPFVSPIDREYILLSALSNGIWLLSGAARCAIFEMTFGNG